ncbi:DNA repair protein RecN [Cellulomonas gelida]|uniref:DNA repair protein RecN n=1 Tax=Cellulomonas gelida TaxID=1712 RepID=A0A4Y3KI29_9CELL|nr:DNA repair protein RecN [Cellulomonas gelida]GEA83034.1 DNA repair protein RecN [Cellulomonas gelida]GGL35975.1 DNA repair protein RecN [Cellulomonas gelida]
MIAEIRIADLGVIGTADVTLGRGLTVLTGETGAGKTMVLTALSLLLGGKADPATVRTGASGASVEGRVVLDADHAAVARALEAGGEVDEDGSLLLVRTVGAAGESGTGRSRAFVGGRSVPQSVLAELAESLVTVHGQADQARLRSSAHQRAALDEFAGPDHGRTLREYRDAWAERARVRQELAELVDRAQDRSREAELLRLGLAEVERVDPQPGEDVELATEEQRLAHAEELRVAAATAHTALAGDESGAEAASAADLVEHARRALEHVASHDPALAELATRVGEAGYLLADAAAELAAYAGDLAADPRRLEVVNQRRAELATLTRAYGSDVAEVLEWARTAGLRLLDLEGGDQRIDELRAQVATLDERIGALAGTLSATRTAAAERLAKVVSAELAGLAMAGARIVVSVAPTDEPGPYGVDDVSMLLVPHAGAPARPLGKGASGGELSRVMLALEVALAEGSGGDRPGTFVFDEVDAGVGGKAAVEVGRRLAALARDAQVLVVTHLAQVAAFADHHLVVTKSSHDGVDVVTASDVTSVTGEGRVRELARMLSGQEDSDAARAHAAELLDLSAVGR